MPAEIRTHLELQTFADRRARQSHVKPVQDEDSSHQLKLGSTRPGTDGDWMGQEQGSGQRQEQRERERKGKSEVKPMSEKFEEW